MSSVENSLAYAKAISILAGEMDLTPSEHIFALSKCLSIAKKTFLKIGCECSSCEKLGKLIKEGDFNG